MNNDDKHDADNLIHGVQFAAVMEQMPWPEPSQNGYIYFFDANDNRLHY
jgi:hypothetical protein